MPARRRSRQRALQTLFLWDQRKLPVERAIEIFNTHLSLAEAEEERGEDLPPDQVPAPDAFQESLVRGTARQIEELDELIARRAENWRLERMPGVDRNILRMAIYEMKEEGTPPAVVIDEALELARRYSEPDAIPFLNGVLDSIRKIILPETVGPSTG